MNLDRTVEFYRLAGKLYMPGQAPLEIQEFIGDPEEEELFE